MAFQTNVVKLTSPTSTGNQSTTGVGFQPKAIIFFATRQTSEGSAADAHIALGCATSATKRGGATSVSKYVLSGTSDTGRRSSDTLVIQLIDDSNALIVGADLVSMDSGGFTLNFTTVAASAYNIYALCLGGDSLTNASVVNWTSATATGNQSITGVGFQPDAIVMMTAGNSAFNSGAATFFSSIGAGTSATARWASGHRDSDGQSTTVTERTQRVAKIWSLPNGSAGISSDGDLVSLDADGFTVNVQTGTTARVMTTLCLKGGSYKVGTFNQATGTGNQSTTGIGFKPAGILLSSFNNVTSTSVLTNMRWSLGMATSASARASIWSGSVAGATNQSLTDQNNDSTKTLRMMTAAGAGNPTTQAIADLVSMDSDGFTLNWSTADATAREITYLAFGPASTGSTHPTGITSSMGGYQ